VRSTLTLLTEDAEESAARRVRRATKRMALSYMPRPYGGKIVYLTCRERRKMRGEPETLREASWQLLAEGGFELLDTPGSHLKVLMHPYVQRQHGTPTRFERDITFSRFIRF
jgi:hypothetical protein